MRVFLAIHNVHHELYRLQESELPFCQSEYSARVGEAINLSKEMVSLIAAPIHPTHHSQLQNVFLQRNHRQQVSPLIASH